MAVLLDGVDITAYCTMPEEVGGKPIKWTRRGGRPSSLSVHGPMELLGGAVGMSTLELTGIGAGFEGVLWRRDDEADEDHAWSTLLAFDPTIYFPKRIVKDGSDPPADPEGEIDPGNFSDPSIIEDNLYGPSIMAAAVNNSNSLDGVFGPTGLSVGGVNLDLAIDLTGFRPSSWPITLDDLRGLLQNGGVCDYIVNGTSVSFYEGNAGSPSGASFGYGTGTFNCRGFKRSQDMDNVFNVIWTLLGAKEPQYAGDVQHWKGNVTIDDTGTNPLNPITFGNGIPDPPYSAVAAQVLASRAAYSRMQTVDEYDAYRDERTPMAKRNKRRLYQMLWLQKSLYCANPRQIVHMMPEQGIAPSFDVYDTVSVAGPGFSGEQRVYEFTVEIDTEGNPELTELQTSPNL